MEFKIFTSIHETDATIWDSHVDTIHFYHSHDFLSCLQDGKVEGADFWYVMIHDNGTLVSTAVLSSFVINLDLMIGSHWLSRLESLTRTNLFKVKILFCGTPVSIGHKNIYCVEGYESKSYAIVANLMEEIARKNKIKHLVFKEFLQSEVAITDTIFPKLGYFRGYSLPYISLPVEWDNYHDYLDKMRHGYRRQIIAAKNKLSDSVSIEIMDSSKVDAKHFFEGYMSVMSRAAVKLEVLNESFFYHFFDRMRGKAIVFTMYDGNRVLSSILAVKARDTLYFVWASKFDSRDDHQSYFNLVDALVRYGIEQGIKTIQLGQTAYYTKQRFGGQAMEVFLYYRALQAWNHKILSKYSKFIFPKIELKRTNVWK